MSKKNSVIKYLKNINNSINNLLEKNLNKLNLDNLRNLITNNKIVLTFVALLILFISYLLLPTFYKQKELVTELKFELSKKLNLNFKFSGKLNYNFFPTPHFIISEANINYKQKDFSHIKKMKVYISIYNLFSIKNIEIKDVEIENANFYFNRNNFDFFLNLLNNKYEKEIFEIKNSNIFFNNSQNEVLFINKILNMKYYYDFKESKNIIISENEIFNIPYQIKLYDDNKQKKLWSEININFLKLKLENEILYKDLVKIGKAYLIYNNSKSVINYKTDKKSFEFNFFEKVENPKFNYNGKINYNPFYSYLTGSTYDLDIFHLFNQNGFISQLLKTEILNNNNIDFKLEINAENFSDNNNFKKINFNSKIQESLIDIDNTNFKWRSFADLKFSDSLIYVKNSELFLDGKVNIKINDHKGIFRYLLTPKKYRKKFSFIEFNFSHNIDQKITTLSDIKIDNIYNKNINEIMSKIFMKDNNLQNKIYIKKMLNEALKSYEG